jgi:DNA polymerase-3 subunit chi
MRHAHRALIMEVGFYHCTRAPAREVAVRLVARAHGSGQRLLVVGEPERLQALDRALWVNDPASFLPHGMAGEGHEAEQPILLSEAPEPANGARLLMLLETGLPAGFDRFERVLNLFEDGSDAHARARADWKALGARDGVSRIYWQQKDGGGWEQRA